MSVDVVEGSEECSCSSVAVEESRDIWSDRIHRLSNYLIQPFWFFEQTIHSYIVLPLHLNEFEKSHIKVQRVFGRVIKGFFMVAPILAALPIAICGMCLTYIGNLLQSRGCHYVAGRYQGEFSSQLRIFSLNTCMLPGGLSYECGGVAPADERFDSLVKMLCTNNPDFVFLSEFNRTLDRLMVDRLKEHYNHFVINVGLNPKGLDAGFFIAYRGDLATPPLFIPFDKRQNGVYAGFITIETPNSYFICTHLDQQEGVQRAQFDQMFHFIETQCKGKKVVLMGSLNFECETGQYRSLLKKGFEDKLEHEETCTNAFKVYLHDRNTKVVSKSSDYILICNQGDTKSQIELHRLPTYDKERYDLQALSDHKALIGVIK